MHVHEHMPEVHAPVWLQRILDGAKHDANIGGVVTRRIEVCVIANRSGKLHDHLK